MYQEASSLGIVHVRRGRTLLLGPFRFGIGLLSRLRNIRYRLGGLGGSEESDGLHKLQWCDTRGWVTES